VDVYFSELNVGSRESRVEIIRGPFTFFYAKLIPVVPYRGDENRTCPSQIVTPNFATPQDCEEERIKRFGQLGEAPSSLALL
jgi:hypothetical protein